ncbi:hypothetical protein [Novosphingobium sp. SG720]|uniref:hypothetical protein n=1 Tax=Novosphingobium sp. SG720 TaxID=2586998 RepID=UPI001447D7EE|nr:hypothetical protein [Novosphingobium sp. SG720]NKJ43683.1 isoaspartyl peptidase/L-asparaginase-like protein (Ntn-hydrolase superfamily) [Novosphingobium sp. SG720]
MSATAPNPLSDELMDQLCDAARLKIGLAIAAHVEALPKEIHAGQALWLTLGGAITAIAEAIALLEQRAPTIAGFASMAEQFQLSYEAAKAAPVGHA